MKTLFAILPAFAILGIAAVHFYWVFGGKKWIGLVIPQVENSTLKKFEPGPALTFLVALIFVGMAFVVLGNAGLFSFQPIDNQWVTMLCRAIGALFIVRAIGDFRYVGFFKKVKNTAFAEHDSRLFSPLSLGIGLLILASSFF